MSLCLCVYLKNFAEPIWFFFTVKLVTVIKRIALGGCFGDFEVFRDSFRVYGRFVTILEEGIFTLLRETAPG